jgi:uncharacterized protein YkuJ
MKRKMPGILRVLGMLVVLLPLVVTAQGKKTVKKFNLKSTTVNTTDYSDGKERTFTESIEKFDKEGNVIEDTEFNKDGTFKKKETRIYNKAGDITQECHYDKNDALINKLVITYNDNNDKLSEQKTDGNGKIISWVKYGYDAMGEKIFELELDEKGKTITKSLFSYDSKGLKKEKKVYDGNEVLLSVKKYTYKTTGDD